MKVRSNCRKIHIDSKLWQYKVGYPNVVIYSPDGVKYTPFRHRISGVAGFGTDDPVWEDLISIHEGRIRPGDVKKYIEDNLIERKNNGNYIS